MLMRTRAGTCAAGLAAAVLSLAVPGSLHGAVDSTRLPLPPPATRASQLIELSLGTPRSTVQGYLVAARAARYADAARYLDLTQIAEPERATKGPLIARELKIVLDQKLWVDPETLSDQPEGDLQDGLKPNRDRVGVIETSRGAFEIALRRTEGAGEGGEWRFSPGTIERVQLIYSEMGYGTLLRLLPDWATRMRVGNMEGWQWIALMLIVLIAALVSRMLTEAIYAVVHRLTRRTEPGFRDRLLDAVRLSVRLASAMGIITVGAFYLRLSIPARSALTKIWIGLIFALAAYTLMRLVDFAAARTLERLQAQGRRSGVSTLFLLKRTLKGVILAVAALALLQNLGLNVTGLLTGFGIAGAAIALAAQKTIENLFGGLVLAADEPVRIGDFCRFGNQQGVVEDIGLRSTRIRTLDRSVVYVPNAEMSSVQIENLALRDRIRLLTTLSLRYETTEEQLAAVLRGVRDMLAKDARVSPEDLRVRFVAFGPYSLDVEVTAYVLTTDLPTFLEIREDLFLRIMKIVRESGTGFAFPSQTLYVARDEGADGGLPGAEPRPGPGTQARSTLP